MLQHARSVQRSRAISNENSQLQVMNSSRAYLYYTYLALKYCSRLRWLR